MEFQYIGLGEYVYRAKTPARYYGQQMKCLECNCCGLVRGAKLWICTRCEQQFCDQCSTLDTCPVKCGGRKLIQNKGIEGFLSEVEYRCRNVKCQAFLPIAQFDSHNESCAFRKVMCTMDGCQWKRNVGSLAGHLTSRHSVSVVNIEFNETYIWVNEIPESLIADLYDFHNVSYKFEAAIICLTSVDAYFLLRVSIIKSKLKVNLVELAQTGDAYVACLTTEGRSVPPPRTKRSLVSTVERVVPSIMDNPSKIADSVWSVNSTELRQLISLDKMATLAFTFPREAKPTDVAEPAKKPKIIEKSTKGEDSFLPRLVPKPQKMETTLRKDNNLRLWKNSTEIKGREPYSEGAPLSGFQNRRQVFRE